MDMNEIKQLDSDSTIVENSVAMRFLIPNTITLLALCAGISAIGLAFEMRFEKAIMLVLIAATLDCFDGRIARLLNASTPFGAQFDSLADAINFGVAPGMILYVYILHNIKSLGWIAVLIYSIACCLRLARFNAALDDPKILKWQKNYFQGIPAPAGALLVLLPVYLGALGLEYSKFLTFFFFFYTIVIAVLLISRLPVWNAKNLNSFLRRDFLVMLLLFLVAYVSFMVAYPWEVLSITAFLYLMFLPISFIIYRRQAKGYSPVK